MKTKRWVALALAFLMALALASVALAKPSASPRGWTIRGVTDNVKDKQLSMTTIKSPKAVEDLRKAAYKFAEEKYGKDPELKEGYQIVELVSAEIRATITGNKDGTVEMKVPGAKVGDRVFIVIRYPNGTTENQEKIVVEDGIIRFTIKGNCTISVMKVIKKGEKYTTGGGIVLPAR